jgi:hypothetical protein
MTDIGARSLDDMRQGGIHEDCAVGRIAEVVRDLQCMVEGTASG